MQNIKLAVDAVVFGYDRKEGISVLLIRRNIEPFIHEWALPGGLVLDHESLEEAISRELEEEAGVKINYMEQLYSFGAPERDPRNRVVSVAYYVLVKPSVFSLKASTDAADAQWFNIKSLPPLAFDHQYIITTAMKRLKAKIRYEPIGFELLAEKFPFSALEDLYNCLLDSPIDRRNFKKKLMSYGLIEELNEQIKDGPGRPARLFQFNKEKYDALKSAESGIHFSI